MQTLKTVMKEQSLKIFNILFLLITSSSCTKVHSCFEQNNYSTLCLLGEKIHHAVEYFGDFYLWE